MESTVLALVGIIGTFAGGMFWFLKFFARKMFGKEGTNDRGVAGELNDNFRQMNTDLRENTTVVRGLKKSQDMANETLLQILNHQKNNGKTTLRPNG